jgi:hypothetical protein
VRGAPGCLSLALDAIPREGWAVLGGAPDEDGPDAEGWDALRLARDHQQKGCAGCTLTK